METLGLFHDLLEATFYITETIMWLEVGYGYLVWTSIFTISVFNSRTLEVGNSDMCEVSITA